MILDYGNKAEKSSQAIYDKKCIKIKEEKQISQLFAVEKRERIKKHEELKTNSLYTLIKKN